VKILKTRKSSVKVTGYPKPTAYLRQKDLQLIRNESKANYRNISFRDETHENCIDIEEIFVGVPEDEKARLYTFADVALIVENDRV
jgi:hypothetical protein